ncbi:hypothetical protein KGA66_08735 [Actinocrinis puniceicyclus]|uniref:CobW/HypB/UreG nucleotide-binding domain-containing protein n=1 Tax=Actinocrinis puniceicyclus TaxID=977794 RepID=A0A8J8BBH2_9ACTN|nr:GTP-binding protein [Actinocrinis puniceicyclus]MBS2963128.1 hypothetical protein [Actinocrinis puniceicyclus]
MITLVPLSGFLGSGKTTTLISAAIALQRTGRRVAVVTNDPGEALVDTGLARGGLGEVTELAGGCLCRRVPELSALLAEAAESGRTDLVLVEASGACADLYENVVRPLRARRDLVTVAPLTAVVDPLRLDAVNRIAQDGEPEADFAHLFGRQLADAELLAINKTDLLGGERTAKFEARLAADHPDAAVLSYSAATGAGLDALVRAWTRPPAHAPVARRGPAFDPARHAAAEAQLSWLNEAFRVTAAAADFEALSWGAAVLGHLSQWAASTGCFTGHVKLAVRTPAGLAKLSVTDSGAPPRADRAPARPVEHGYATVNARIACRPAALDGALRAALAAADAAHGATSHAPRPASFRTAHQHPSQRPLAATG